jgi:hypothetical protein
MMQEFQVSSQSGSDADCRGNFARIGELNIPKDQTRSIGNSSTVFAFSYNLFNISTTSTEGPIIWAIGYTTDLAINYTDLSGAPPTPRSPYYKSRYSDDIEMASTHSNSWGENV